MIYKVSRIYLIFVLMSLVCHCALAYWYVSHMLTPDSGLQQSVLTVRLASLTRSGISGKADQPPRSEVEKKHTGSSSLQHQEKVNVSSKQATDPANNNQARHLSIAAPGNTNTGTQEHFDTPPTAVASLAISSVSPQSEVEPTLRSPASVDRPRQRNTEAVSRLADKKAKEAELVEMQVTTVDLVAVADPVFKAPAGASLPESETSDSPARTANGNQVNNGTSSENSPRYVIGRKHTPKPGYPRPAKNRGWQGQVIVALEVSADGAVVNAKIEKSSGYRVLDKAALKTLADWKLDPSSVELETLQVPVIFRIE